MILGVKELVQDLRKVKGAVRNATRAAAYAGVVVFRDALRRAAPTSKGGTRRTIVAKRKQSPNQGTGIAHAGILPSGFFLTILSSGAKTHELVAHEVTKIIDPKTRRVTGKRLKTRLVMVAAKAGGPRNSRFIGPRATHPGLRARNWIRPVIDANKQKAVDAVADRYTEAITKAVGSGPTT